MMISGKELSTTSAPCFVQEVKSTQFLLLGLTFTPFRRESICTCMLNTAQREEEKETYESVQDWLSRSDFSLFYCLFHSDGMGFSLLIPKPLNHS